MILHSMKQFIRLLTRQSSPRAAPREGDLDVHPQLAGLQFCEVRHIIITRTLVSYTSVTVS